MYVQRAKRPQRRQLQTQPVVVMAGGLEIIPGYGVISALYRRTH